MNEPLWLSVAAASRRYSIAPWRLYELAQAGEVERRYVTAQRYVLKVASVEAWLLAQPDERVVAR